MTNFKEIEYKYMAEEIDRSAFDKLCKSLKPIKSIDISSEDGKSTDHYFTKNNRFMRFRNSNGKWELTSKVKHSETNNKVRTEVNIKLGAGFNIGKAEIFTDIFGLKPDFVISKDVVVYWYDKIVLSHYTCFTPEGKELDTFLEIECDEEYPWESEEQALAELAEWEKKLAPLGLTPQKRVRKSLFEFYTKIGG